MKRGRHYNFGPGYGYNPYGPYSGNFYKKKNKGLFFFAVIVLVIVVGYISFSHSGIKLPKLNLPNSSNASGSSSSSSLANQNQENQAGQTLTPVQMCEQKVTQCGSIINSKYGYDVTVINGSEAETSYDANQFLQTWTSSSQSNQISSYDISPPLILVAARFDAQNGTKTPHVFICSLNGTFESKSVSGLC